MTTPVERLAKLICGNSEAFKSTSIRRMHMKEARCVIKSGWIHKDQAVEYVSVCRSCWCGEMPSEIGKGMIACPVCSGKGVVPREGG